MPTYEYACKECGVQFEIVQSFHDDPLTVCSTCGGQLRKVFGNIAITFKGGGFYKTDSRSQTSSTVSTSATSDSKGATTTASTAGEAKASESAKSTASNSTDAA